MPRWGWEEGADFCTAALQSGHNGGQWRAGGADGAVGGAGRDRSPKLGDHFSDPVFQTPRKGEGTAAGRAGLRGSWVCFPGLFHPAGAGPGCRGASTSASASERPPQEPPGQVGGARRPQ